jgi:hypothetical protein
VQWMGQNPQHGNRGTESRRHQKEEEEGPRGAKGA